MSDVATLSNEHLLDDVEVANFVANGYRILEPDLPEGLNEAAALKLDELEQNPGDGIMDVVPELWQVVEHEVVKGVMTSLLGTGYELLSHRHWHCRQPGTGHMQWHQDSTNRRDIRLEQLLGLYYPRDVSADMGPTIVVPGTHFRNAPTDRMATYTNIKGQVPLIVKAGTFAITHYDMWHGTSANRSGVKRHMIKFLFRRTKDNTAPTWNHDPARVDQPFSYGDPQATNARTALRSANPLGVSQSDHYKEIKIRTECFDQLLGKTAG